MLDKSVPYIDVLMRRKSGNPVQVFELPDGYSYSFFKAGDEKEWAKIETSVLEFPTESDAFIYFQKEYLPFISELERRCVFIENDKGEKIATGTAWWCYSGVRRDPWIYWIAVKPQYQGLGLGKSIISKVINLILDIEGDRDIYLHTQTWSHKAIKIYEKLGFYITDENNLYKYSNKDYAKAIELLEHIENKYNIKN